MAARASWRGYLRISLVTFPIELHPAFLSSRNVPLHQIHKKTGKRVKHLKMVPGVGEVDQDEIVKGFEYRKGHYVQLDPEEVQNLRLSTTKTIDVVEFVDPDEIDLIYYDNPYYVVPQGEMAEEAYAVVRQALKDTKKAAIGEVVFAGKEHLVAIRPCGKGMLLETLRYADEVRKAHKYFDDLGTAKPSADQLALAKQLIKKQTSSFKVEDYDDSYESALRDLVERKLKKLPIREEKDEEVPSNVISLMDALKKSVKSKSKAKPSKVQKTKARAKTKSSAKRKSA